ncbi:AAA family ATPase [Chitinivorax sp. B]|uniref:AAA family ATPase n=1 Tax=Chitinivorax sp. B TaxID=2502235 RepID=UPI0010F96D4B|nr:AAA family ATPase [Chitinivorax sp. B]
MAGLDSQFEHGLVIGKFYPPHAGHYYLIRTAAAYCRLVTVGVHPASQESISLADRLVWMREDLADCPNVTVVGKYDDTPVDYHNPAIWDAHEAHFRQAIVLADQQRQTVAPPVDAVFASEPYVVELARRFQATPVCLDQSRVSYAISGTQVRQNPVGTWAMLTPAVRAGLCKRIVVVGAESTGTTTLSRDLTNTLQQRGGVWAATQYVAEFGREHSWNKLAIGRGLAMQQDQPLPVMADLDWQSPEFAFIAATQSTREEAAARQSSPLLICDTDAFATAIWHERYVGCSSVAVAQVIEAMPPRSLYLLTDHVGVPFEDDGLRDGEHIRSWMTDRFADVLSKQTVPWLRLTGDRQSRLDQALRAVDTLLVKGWHFAPPI